MKTGFLAILLLLMATVAAQAAVADTASLLQDIHDLGTLPLLSDGNCRQFSSYDRTGGNDDRGHYLSVSEDGTVLLADMKGPGAIVRIWSAGPKGFLKIFLDDNPEPVIAMPFMDFFTDPALHPIRTTSSGGFISYYPIPYEKSCRVVSEDGGNMYYHVTYQTFGPGTQVRSYTKELAPEAKKQLDAALAAWRNPSDLAPTARPEALGPVKNPISGKVSVNAVPGERTALFSLDGAGCLDYFAISADTSDQFDLRKAIIRAYWDGETAPSIEAPLIDFFANGFHKIGYESIALGIKADGTFYCQFPMPFSKSARMEVENGGQEPLNLQVEFRGRELASLKEGVGLFHAKWRQDFTELGQPYLLLRTEGRGRFVGVNMTMQSYRGLGFLEGDEFIFVDGEKEPSFYGTGTEDYFNSGWYFATGPVAQPVHGAPVKDDAKRQVAAYRFHIPDYVDYQRELTVEMEHGGTNDSPGADYSSVAYYYQVEPHVEFFRMPAASTINPPRIPVAETVPGTIEVENLQFRAENGSVAVSTWDDISRDLRGGKVVVLTPEGDNAALMVPFEVQFKDRYSVSAHFAAGEGFTGAAAEINGKPLPNNFTASVGERQPAQPVVLGELVLEPGEHVLKVRPVGGGAVGLDRIAIDSQSPFIPNWYLIGPFDNPGDQEAFDLAYLPETQAFNPSANYRGKDGATVRWQEVNNPGLIYINELLSPTEQTVAYALTHIISPDERKVEVLLGSDEAVKVWLNREQVWKHRIARSLQADDDRFTMTLKPGVNELLLKITQVGGRWGYVVRLRDPDNTLKYSAARPQDVQ